MRNKRSSSGQPVNSNQQGTVNSSAGDEAGGEDHNSEAAGAGSSTEETTTTPSFASSSGGMKNKNNNPDGSSSSSTTSSSGDGAILEQVKEGAERLAQELDDYLSSKQPPSSSDKYTPLKTATKDSPEDQIADMQLTTARKLREVSARQHA